MAIYYDRVFKVPSWFVVDGLPDKQTKIVENWFNDADALPVKWPSATFKQTCESLTKKGWGHALLLPVPYMMRDDVLTRAAGDHVRTFFGSQAFLSQRTLQPIHHINRNVSSDADYERIFNGILFIQPVESVCKLFKIAERCFFDKKKYKAFVTFGKPAIDILTKISERVITIGSQENCDILIDGKDKKQEISDKIESFIVQLQEKGKDTL